MIVRAREHRRAADNRSLDGQHHHRSLLLAPVKFRADGEVVRLDSGDAIVFDGVNVLHGVDGFIPGSTPSFLTTPAATTTMTAR